VAGKGRREAGRRTRLEPVRQSPWPVVVAIVVAEHVVATQVGRYPCGHYVRRSIARFQGGGRACQQACEWPRLPRSPPAADTATQLELACRGTTGVAQLH